MSIELAPISQHACRAFVNEHHRHNHAPQGDLFRVALVEDSEIIAVGIAGRPVAAGLQDGRSFEITRICTLGHGNACSRLYGALCRAGKALGYTTAFTYTLASETGTSPRAAGFRFDAELDERDWSSEYGQARYHENLFGERTTPAGAKLRWRRDL